MISKFKIKQIPTFQIPSSLRFALPFPKEKTGKKKADKQCGRNSAEEAVREKQAAKGNGINPAGGLRALKQIFMP